MNADAVRDDAERHLDSDFLYRKPWAIHVGRRLKDSPDLPDQCFGRLAPLGVTSLGVVAPWLGFVPAAGLDKWFHWRVGDLPWAEGPQLDIHDLDIEVWVRPRFRAANKAVEMAAEGIKVPAATEAADELPRCGSRRSLSRHVTPWASSLDRSSGWWARMGRAFPSNA